MSGGIYTTDKSKTLASLADVDLENIQNGQAPVYDSTQELFTNQTVLTPSSLPSGSSGDVIISDGAGGIDSTNRLNVNPTNGTITGTFLNVDNTNVKLSTSAGSGAGNDNISIGYQSGLNAGNYAVAIGTIAGQSGGTNSVSLGLNAQANDDNCIVINGSGTLTDSKQTDSCYINPVRDVNATTLPSPFVVQYDDTNKELIKSEDLHTRDIQNRDIDNQGTLTNVGTASLYNGQLTVGTTLDRAIIGSPNPILSVDLQNRRVGINILNPTEDLDVDGNIQLNSATTSKIVFYDSNDDHEHAEIDATDDGTTNGGQLQFHTKVDGGSVSEKLRINNVGAIGLGGANYGSAGQLLKSNGSGSAVSWTNTLTNTTTSGTFNINSPLQLGGSYGTGTGASAVLSGNGSLTHPSWINIYDLMYPIHSVFIWYSDTDWDKFSGSGQTWEEFAQGRILVGRDTADTDFNNVGDTGGSKTHSLTQAEMPRHTHTQNSHNHTQNAHNHTQNSHNHTQNPHNHTQNPHNHLQSQSTNLPGGNQITGVTANGVGAGPNGATFNNTAINNATIATNQATTATNQATTATNQATTATNQHSGGVGSAQTDSNGQAHTIVQPYVVVRYYRRTA